MLIASTLIQLSPPRTGLSSRGRESSEERGSRFESGGTGLYHYLIKNARPNVLGL
jgi:hypothetical protein